MWCNIEDLAIISDMYQIKIKIISTKGREDKNPTVNWIYPDQGMKKFAELKDIDIGEMVLFHENECHFNLIVSKQCDLAVNGSLSYRFNKSIDDIVREETKEDSEDVEGQEIKTKMKELEKELKR